MCFMFMISLDSVCFFSQLALGYPTEFVLITCMSKGSFSNLRFLETEKEMAGPLATCLVVCFVGWLID